MYPESKHVALGQKMIGFAILVPFDKTNTIYITGVTLANGTSIPNDKLP